MWSREFHDTARIYTPPQVIVDAAAQSDSGSAPRNRHGDAGRDDDPDRAFFNSATDVIRFPTRYLTAVHTAHGPRAHLVLTFTMGHEFGHHVQFLIHPRTDALVNDLEVQADCYAGVWARQEADAGMLDTEQFRAAADAELRRLSSYRDETSTHGKPDQRVESLDKGLGSGDPAICDQGRLTWLPHRPGGPPA